jgi:hypothetical protein
VCAYLFVFKNDGKKKVDVFEDAFRKIQEATGVTDINEVIQKILNQEGTTDNLILLTKENQSKIEHLSKTRHDLKEKVVVHLTGGWAIFRSSKCILTPPHAFSYAPFLAFSETIISILTSYCKCLVLISF